MEKWLKQQPFPNSIRYRLILCVKLNTEMRRFFMDKQQKWMDWAIELQSLAQAGLYYSENAFDIERFERIREITVEMMAEQTDWEVTKVREVFASEVGYQTPKLDSRAAIISDGKILLVQESDGLWALPGGWVDVNQTLRENLVKEAKEEAGIDVVVDRVIALHDRNKHNAGHYANPIVKVFALCTSLGGMFEPNSETLDAKYFAREELPPLSEHKTTAEQIAMCFQAYETPDWQVEWD